MHLSFLAPSPPPLIPEVFERALELLVFSLPSLQRKIRCITFPLCMPDDGAEVLVQPRFAGLRLPRHTGRVRRQQPPLREAGGGTARRGQTPRRASAGAPVPAAGAERRGALRAGADRGSRARRRPAAGLRIICGLGSGLSCACAGVGFGSVVFVVVVVVVCRRLAMFF